MKSQHQCPGERPQYWHHRRPVNIRVSPERWCAGQQYNLTAPHPAVTTWRWSSPQPSCSALSRLAWLQPRRRRPPIWAASPSRTAVSSVCVDLSTPRSSWKDPDPKLVLVQATAISLPWTSSAINLRGKTISYINLGSWGMNIISINYFRDWLWSNCASMCNSKYDFQVSNFCA